MKKYLAKRNREKYWKHIEKQINEMIEGGKNFEIACYLVYISDLILCFD